MADKKEDYYQAYGLKINSEFPLPELVKATPPGEDVRVRLGSLTKSLLEKELSEAFIIGDSTSAAAARVASESIWVHWKGFGGALIRKGNEIIVEPESGKEASDLSPFINGPILAALMHQRGLLVLHASAVIIRNEAVVFVGEKGAGKSTFAAYLQTRGCGVLTDDLVPVVFSGENIETMPGYPRIRLWDDSIKSVGLDPKTLPQINKFINKRLFGSLENFPSEPVKLNRIYVLVESPEIEIDELSPQQAFIEVTRHTYLARHLNATGKTATHFRQCQELISSIPVFALKRPHDFNLLPNVAEAVENHLGRP